MTKPPTTIPPELLAGAGMISLQGATEPGADEVILRQMAHANGLDFAMDRLIAYRNRFYPASHPRHWAIVNFDLHSAKERLFLFDVTGPAVQTYLCAHGSGSEGPKDDGYAEVFSNVPGSNMTSLGIYRCAETYEGHHGHSMRLDGLEETNSNARGRDIVMHSAFYVTPEFARQFKRIGRSNGCPALDPAHSTDVIDRLKFGSFLLHWKTP